MLSAWVLALATVAGCGGGGGSSSGPGFGGTQTGVWAYTGAGTAVRFDLASGNETSLALSPQSQQNLGYGGATFTDVDEQRFTTSRPNEYTVNLRNSSPAPFSIRSSLPPIKLTGGHVSGPVQTSPDAALFAVHTIESAGLGLPDLDYVTLIDANIVVQWRLVGYRDPVWLGSDRVLVVGDDGLFAVTAVPSPTLTRIGLPIAQPSRPSVSPDGKSIAFVQGDITWRIGADGTGLAQVTQASSGQTWPAWSPDGTKLAIVKGDCPPVGGGVPDPTVVVVSANTPNQDLSQAVTVARIGGAPVRTCGPVYWLP